MHHLGSIAVCLEVWNVDWVWKSGEMWQSTFPLYDELFFQVCHMQVQRRTLNTRARAKASGRVGLVRAPNVGKSTMLRDLSAGQVHGRAFLLGMCLWCWTWLLALSMLQRTGMPLVVNMVESTLRCWCGLWDSCWKAVWEGAYAGWHVCGSEVPSHACLCCQFFLALHFGMNYTSSNTRFEGKE